MPRPFPEEARLGLDPPPRRSDGGTPRRRPIGTYARILMAEAHNSPTPLLDGRIDEIGEDAVAEIVEDARRRAAEGSLPAFDNAADVASYMRRHCRQSS